MKLLFICLILAVNVSAVAPTVKVMNFELSDQHAQARSYRFPRARVTLMTVADQKGSARLAPWIQSIYDRYRDRIDIDGIADVSMIPKPLHGMFRSAFRKQLARSVLLDWEGTVVSSFAYARGVPNIYVIDCEGRIVARGSGDVNEEALAAITRGIDRALEGGSK